MATRVLVVDDDHDIREALAEVLSSEGFDVVQASDGREALASIVQRAPDLVLLDLMMPVMNGWQLLHTLRHSPRYAAIPVVVLSAVQAHGCTDYLQKPVSVERLLSVIDSVKVRKSVTSQAEAAAAG